MNVKKIISLIMLLFMLLPLGAQNSDMGHRTKRILRIERKEYQTY